MKTREQRKQERRSMALLWALCILAAMALLCVDAYAVFDPEQYKTSLSVAGAWCAAGGAMRVLQWLEGGRR